MILECLLRCVMQLESGSMNATAAQWAVLARQGMLNLYLHYGGKRPSGLTEDLSLQASILSKISLAQHALVAELYDSLQADPLALNVRLGLIKGAALAQQIYPSVDCRPMSDVDLLVDPDQAKLVRKHLYKKGFVDYASPHVGSQGRDHHGAPLHHPERGLWVEVHTALFPSEQPIAHLPEFQHPYEALQPLQVGAREFWTLPIELHFLYVAAHWAQVVEPRGKVHGLVDLALMLLNCPEGLSRTINEVTNREMARSLLVVLGILGRCGMPWPAQLDRNRLMQVAKFDRWRLSTLVSMGRQLVLHESGGYHVLGRHFCAQWWVDWMESKSLSEAVFKLLYRIFVPRHYGGLRGVALLRSRLGALWGRLWKA